MTEPEAQEEVPATPEDIAEAQAAEAAAMATTELAGLIASDDPVRMVQDGYVGIVAAGRRFRAGEGDIADVQAELDRVFEPGLILADDVTTPPDEVAP